MNDGEQDGSNASSKSRSPNEFKNKLLECILNPSFIEILIFKHTNALTPQ